MLRLSAGTLVKSLISIVAQNEFPVVYVTLSSASELHGCLKRAFFHDGMTSHVFVSSGFHGIFFLLGSTLHGMTWRVDYSLEFHAPFPGDYVVDVIEEYSSFNDSMTDYPAAKSSFVHRNEHFQSTISVSGAEAVLSSLYEDVWIRGCDAFQISNYRSCVPWNLTPLTFIGDSVPMQNCHRVKYRYPLVNISCISTNHVISSVNGVESFLKLFPPVDDSRIVLFNPSGLWEVAYGQVADYKNVFATILKGISDLGYKKLIYMTTTSLFPRHYSTLFKDEVKWAMTQTRVDWINLLSVSVAASFEPFVQVIDVGRPTMTMSRDPLTPTDMRHFGNGTTDMLVDYILCSISTDFR